MQRFGSQYFITQHRLDHPSKFRHFDGIASKTVCEAQKAIRGWSPDWPNAHSEPQSPSLTSLGLRGVRKAREPGSCSTSYPALRFAVRAAGNSRAFADDYGNSSRQETVTVGQLHTLFRPKSKGDDQKPRYWCLACGETIHKSGTGRAQQYCSIECIEWDLNDARRSRDGVRLNRLYVLRGWWRKKTGVVV